MMHERTTDTYRELEHAFEMILNTFGITEEGCDGIESRSNERYDCLHAMLNQVIDRVNELDKRLTADCDDIRTQMKSNHDQLDDSIDEVRGYCTDSLEENQEDLETFREEFEQRVDDIERSANIQQIQLLVDEVDELKRRNELLEQRIEELEENQHPIVCIQPCVASEEKLSSRIDDLEKMLFATENCILKRAINGDRQ